MSETCDQCSTVGACPFAFTDDSEQVQNYGCLPTPNEIVLMRTKHNKTWACHSNTQKPCLGALRTMNDQGIDCTIVDSELITEEHDWDQYTK